jgi:NADH-quinone oxidoreductase subunit C
MDKQPRFIIGDSGFKIEVVREAEGYFHVRVSRDNAVELILSAKQRCGKEMLQLISAVDRIEDGIFQLTWILEDPGDSSLFIVSADYPRENCTVPTLGSIWPAAVIFERELHEMYGIDFPGNPRQNEDFLLEGWKELPPMRRDFDTLEYSLRVYGERQKREHRDPREYISQITGEWDTPVPMKDEDR